MKSLKLRIVVTFTLALIGISLAMLWISASITRRVIADFFEGSMQLELQRAQKIFETGGSARLAAYLAETDASLPGTLYLTDASGHDLVSGVDRSRVLPTGFDFLGFPKEQNGEDIIVRQSRDGRYHLVVAAPPPLGFGSFIPYFLAVAIAIALLVWTLFLGIFSPLHRVASTVDRFGRGDLSARVSTDRKDEIGNLARTFNEMADRIQTLLSAERRLLQDVSHELRSPLSRLSLAAELILDASDPAAAVNRVRREIKRLSQLVATLLEVNRVESDPSSIKIEPVPIVPLTQEIITDCSVEADVRNVQIETHMRSTAIVEGDRELLRRAIENVLRNAIRFAPTESCVIVRVDDGDRRVRISIRDHGPGVPEDLLARIFDPFFRTDESRDSAGGGVGLGLSIARRSVLLHRGEITASNAGPGLQVSIRIPASGPAS
jgi:two-component system sensor histidine kinase CpxA